MARRVLLCTVAAAFATAMACGKSSAPTSPSTSSALPSDTGAAPDGSTLKVTAPAPVSPVNGEQPSTLVLVATKATGKFTAIPLSYQFQIRSGSNVVFDSGVVGGGGSGPDQVQYSPVVALTPDGTYTWRARAVFQDAAGPWSADATFKAIAKFNNGREFLDPLLDGSTVGIQHGGQFIPGRGYQLLTPQDGIDYHVDTCSSCTLEFDVAGFGKRVGEDYGADLKWITMGDGTTFPSFGAFRDHPWKMTIEQRADQDQGIKLVWRNGDAGEGDPGDHTFKGDGLTQWSDSHPPYHFVIDWNPGGFAVSIDGRTFVSDGFARPYAPPNHTISLGCWPRGESLVSAIFSNVKLTRH